MRGAGEFTVICFDISDDRRRRRVVRVLESFAYRSQESVFEGCLDGRERRRLRAALAKCINAGADRVAIYALTPIDRADMLSLGRGLPANDFGHALL